MKTKITALLLMVTGLLMAAPQPRDRPLGRGFETLDIDGDGQITLEEFNAAHEARFIELDVNQDGVLTSDEMVRPRHRGRRGDSAARGKIFLLIADSNDDSAVTLAELDAVLEQVVGEDGETIDHDKVMALIPDHPRAGMHMGYRPAPTATQVREMFAQLDRDADGTVTVEEIAATRHRARGGKRGFFLLRAADANGDLVVTEAEWLTFVAGLEIDENGNIDLDALIAAVHAGIDRPGRGNGSGLFARGLDADGDGNLTPADLEAVFDKLDTDGDGSIAFDDIRRGRRGPRGRR